jgi:hypothetical protein
MWASGGKVGKMHLSFQVFNRRDEARNYGDYPASVVFPVAVLDLRPEAVENLTEVIAQVCNEKRCWTNRTVGNAELSRAIVAAILPLRRGRGGK